MDPKQKLDDFLSETRMFFLASVNEEGHPKCRPLGFHMLKDGEVYFGVGDFKDVYRQIVANPHVEIVASTADHFIRYYGKVVFEETYDLAAAVIASNEFLQGIYNDKTGYKMAVFHLEEATFEYRSMMGVEESYSW